MHSLYLTRPWVSTLELPKTGVKKYSASLEVKVHHGDFHEHREAAMISMGVGGTYLEPYAWRPGAKTHQRLVAV